MALDARAGNVLWETTFDDFQKGYSGTVAPLVVKNMVMVGIAGAEFGIARIRGCLRRRHRQTRLAFLDGGRRRRAGRQYLGRRFVEARRRVHLDHRHLRSGAEPDLLGHGQSRSRPERRRAARRQPIHVQPGGAGCRHRQAEMALPIHAA